jgi:hypothetical protein
LKKKPMTPARILAVALTPEEALARMKAAPVKKKPTLLVPGVVLTPEEALSRVREIAGRLAAAPKPETVKGKKKKKRR